MKQYHGIPKTIFIWFGAYQWFLADNCLAVYKDINLMMKYCSQKNGKTTVNLGEIILKYLQETEWQNNEIGVIV